MNSLLKDPNEWQWKDPKAGMLFPWYTKPFLDMLADMKPMIKDWRVLELGSGASTLWWAKHCAELVSVESDPNWHNMVADGLQEMGLNGNVKYHLATNQLEFISHLDTGPYDCIIIDGAHRLECAERLSDKSIKMNGTVILDNFEQYVNPSVIGLLRVNNFTCVYQPGHHNWKTAAWIIDNFNMPDDNHERNSSNQRSKRDQQL